MKPRPTILPPAAPDAPPPKRKRFLSIPELEPIQISSTESAATGETWGAPKPERRGGTAETIKPRKPT
jgi:hypothetical protein